MHLLESDLAILLSTAIHNQARIWLTNISQAIPRVLSVRMNKSPVNLHLAAADMGKAMLVQSTDPTFRCSFPYPNSVIFTHLSILNNCHFILFFQIVLYTVFSRLETGFPKLFFNSFMLYFSRLCATSVLDYREVYAQSNCFRSLDLLLGSQSGLAILNTGSILRLFRWVIPFFFFCRLTYTCLEGSYQL